MWRKSAVTFFVTSSFMLGSVLGCNGRVSNPKTAAQNQDKTFEPMETTIKNTNELNTDLALNYLARPAKVQTGKKKALILLHGVGSNEQDLFGLTNYLPDNFLIISPRGPITLGGGRFAWYQVDFATGKPVFDKNQEETSRKAILKFVQEVKQKYDLDEIYLGGFSQGAIMSYSIGLLNPGEVKGIIALSGRLLTEIRPFVHKSESLENLNVFIAHGKQDGTLPVTYAQEAAAYLKPLGIKLTYQEFEMAHQINQEELQELNNWLK